MDADETFQDDVVAGRTPQAVFVASIGKTHQAAFVDGDRPADAVDCPECWGMGCEACDGMAWTRPVFPPSQFSSAHEWGDRRDDPFFDINDRWGYDHLGNWTNFSDERSAW